MRSWVLTGQSLREERGLNDVHEDAANEADESSAEQEYWTIRWLKRPILLVDSSLPVISGLDEWIGGVNEGRLDGRRGVEFIEHFGDIAG